MSDFNSFASAAASAAAVAASFASSSEFSVPCRSPKLLDAREKETFLLESVEKESTQEQHNATIASTNRCSTTPLLPAPIVAAFQQLRVANNYPPAFQPEQPTAGASFQC
jgi:hypothetical protein